MQSLFSSYVRTCFKTVLCLLIFFVHLLEGIILHFWAHYCKVMFSLPAIFMEQFHVFESTMFVLSMTVKAALCFALCVMECGGF
jgi:hypothetical protein